MFGVPTAGKKEEEPSISGGLETTYQSYEMCSWSLCFLENWDFGKEFINYK